jgi:hypothetical protein
MPRVNRIPQPTSDIAANYVPSSYEAASPTLNSHLAGIDDALSSLASTFSLRGTWNASTNTPDLTAPENVVVGHYYLVSVSGSTDLDGITDWNVGDQLFVAHDQTWRKIDNSDQVVTVFGRQGVIAAEPGDYSADQIAIEQQPLNYDAPLEHVASHLDGIDERLGEALYPDQVTTLQRAAGVVPEALTDAGTVSIDLTISNVFTLTIEGDRTIAFTNLQSGFIYNLLVTQGTGGNHTLTFGSNVLFGEDGAPILSTDEGKIDWLAFLCVGSVLFFAGATKGFELP